MQLKIQRSQRAGGLVGNTVIFCLDVRADYSPEERDNIRKYKLGGQVIYNSQAAKKHLEHAGAHLERTQAGNVGERASGLARGALSMAMAKMSLNISIASLGRGHHIACKDLEELLEAEDTVRTACKNVTRYLEIAATFDGSELVIEYDKGEERIHMTEHAPPLIAYQSKEHGEQETWDETAIASDLPPPPPPSDAFMEMGRQVARGWSKFKTWIGDTAIPAAKERWLAYEKKLLDWMSGYGWKVEQGPFRLACMSLAGLAVSIALVRLIW